MRFLALLFLVSHAAAREIKAVVPIGAEGSIFSRTHQRHICVTVLFDLQTIFRKFVKDETIVSPSASSDHILNVDFGKNHTDMRLWCITSPLSQFARNRTYWQRVTQCYEGDHGSPLPSTLTIPSSTFVDLYQTMDEGNSLLLVDKNVPLAGKLELEVEWMSQENFNILPLIGDSSPCESNTVASARKCPKGCIDVCPQSGESNEFVCLQEFRSDIRRPGRMESVKLGDMMVLNTRSGKIRYLSSVKAIPAQPRDSFLVCPPMGTSKMCHHLSREGICMVDKSPCSIVSVPEYLPPRSVYSLSVSESSFVPAMVQPQIDPLVFCFVSSKGRGPKFISLCTKALLAVSRGSEAFANQQRFVNGSLLEEGYQGGAEPFLIFTGNKTHRGPTPFPGAFILAEITILTTVVSCWLFDMKRKNGQH